jgi:hypothetical protein
MIDVIVTVLLLLLLLLFPYCLSHACYVYCFVLFFFLIVILYVFFFFFFVRLTRTYLTLVQMCVVRMPALHCVVDASSGAKPSIPLWSEALFRSLLDACLDRDAARRPSFTDIILKLRELMVSI